jgi:hypothetical protein
MSKFFYLSWIFFWLVIIKIAQVIWWVFTGEKPRSLLRAIANEKDK